MEPFCNTLVSLWSHLDFFHPSSVLGWGFISLNGLQLSCGGNGPYALIGAHGPTPLAPHLGNKFLPSLLDNHQNLASAKSDTELPCLLLQSVSRIPVPVTSHGNIYIPGRTGVLVSCCLPKSNKEQLGIITPLDGLSFPSSFLAAYTVCQAKGIDVIVRLIYTSNVDLELRAGQKVAQFYPLVESCDPQVFHDTPHDTSISCSIISNVHLANQLASQTDPSLNRNDKDTLLQTLLKFSDVFEDSLGHTNVIQHKIETGSSQSIPQYRRRLPYDYREETRTQVTGMLDQGAIKPSPSPWASPIVLVKKKDGKYRFCIDYRKLNNVTKKDAHLLTRVDDLLDALQGSQIFSTLDLRSGYGQISVAPEHREKTAFVTPDGLWEFIRLPFGVSGGPATF